MHLPAAGLVQLVGCRTGSPKVRILHLAEYFSSTFQCTVASQCFVCEFLLVPSLLFVLLIPLHNIETDTHKLHLTMEDCEVHPEDLCEVSSIWRNTVLDVVEAEILFKPHRSSEAVWCRHYLLTRCRQGSQTNFSVDKYYFWLVFTYAKRTWPLNSKLATIYTRWLVESLDGRPPLPSQTRKKKKKTA